MDNSLATINEHVGLIEQLEQTSDPKVQLDLMQFLGSRLTELGDLREDIELAEAEIYYNLSRLWNNAHLAPEVKEHWDNDFYNWAAEYSLKGRQKVAPVTVDNKARVFKKWLSPEATIAPPPEVYIEELVDGEPDYYTVKFDARKVPYSKLLAATGAASRGDMNEEAWTALMNPDATVQTLKGELYKAKMAVADKDPEELADLGPESVVFNGGGILYYQQDGMTVPFAQLLYENKDNPLFAHAANRLLQMFGLKADNELTVEIPDGNKTEVRTVFNGDKQPSGVQLYHRGRGFATFTLQEANELLAGLVELLEKEENYA